MANTYESKFKGVEIDDGVNTATYATGTGGINVTIKGTTNVTGTGGRHLEIDGSGKQDKFTDDLIVHLDKPITGFESKSIIGIYANNGRVVLEAPSDLSPTGASYVLPAGRGTVPLASTESLPRIVQATGTATGSVMSQKAVTDELGKKQDKLTTGSEISIKKLQATTIGAQDNGSLTIVDPLTVSNDVYVNELAATKGTFWSGAIVQGTLTGETAHFATGVTVDGYSSFNGIHVDNSTTKPICFKRNGSIVTKMYGPTSGGGELVNVYLPGKGGTLALTSDIPTGGGSAGVSSIGGKTGAITLSTGLAMSGQQLVNKVKVYTSGNYLCIDTN